MLDAARGAMNVPVISDTDCEAAWERAKQRRGRAPGRKQKAEGRKQKCFLLTKSVHDF